MHSILLKKYRWLFITSFFLPLVNMSGLALANLEKETESKPNLLPFISQKIIIKEHMKGHFEQRKFISILPKPLISKGHFQFNHSESLEWFVDTPIKNHLSFNQQGIVQSQNGQEIWSASNEEPSIAAIGKILHAILSNDWTTLQSYFLIDGNSVDPQWNLILTPKEATLQKIMSHITIKGQQHIQRVIIFETNDDRTELLFTRIKY
jgi:hypothetical protein